MPFPAFEKKKATPSRRRIRRLHKSQLRDDAKPYVLDPATLYEIELGTVLRTFARWVIKRGWAPTVSDVVFSKTWNERALRRYVDDLAGKGLLRTVPGVGYMPTEEGWIASRFAPTQPKYSTNPRARREQMRHEREVRESIECHENALSAS